VTRRLLVSGYKDDDVDARAPTLATLGVISSTPVASDPRDSPTVALAIAWSRGHHRCIKPCCAGHGAMPTHDVRSRGVTALTSSTSSHWHDACVAGRDRRRARASIRSPALRSAVMTAPTAATPGDDWGPWPGKRRRDGDAGPRSPISTALALSTSRPPLVCALHPDPVSAVPADLIIAGVPLGLSSRRRRPRLGRLRARDGGDRPCPRGCIRSLGTSRSAMPHAAT
jgi:hypothetical protein